ncbi:MAG: rod shape-determining protein RodA [Candidatus Moranbacteria bacterium CG23_combo_of_CG06-09_8_20_14_all_35_22]|nr:MAG: rod shape-determining protein RodA [Candidatus Moranbacteria bacterium CG23_combo_of_CG06-09_8_20_14_all_35_22]
MNKLLKLDWILIISISLLLLVSLLVIYSISFSGSVFNASNFQKQSISIIIGILAMFFLAFFDYRLLNYHSTKLYFLMLSILVAVIFLGKTVKGNTGWLEFFFFNVQPVEIAKIIIIIFLASFLSKKKTQLSIIIRIIASIVLIFIPVFLILKQPDLGSSSVILSGWLVLLLASGLNKKNLALLVIVGILATSSSWFFLKDYQKNRIINFVKPQHDPMGSGYNVIQATIAVGSGGIFGKGLGHGSQSQLNFLPEKHTDFIFSVITEELGLLGALAIFIIFGIIFWRIKETAKLARDNFGYLITLGILTILFFQFFINVGMNIGVMPVTGVPLPFLSYGGSSMVVMLSAIGLVQSVYIRRIKT